MTTALRVRFLCARPQETAGVPAVVEIFDRKLIPVVHRRATLMGAELRVELEPDLYGIRAHLPSGLMLSATVQLEASFDTEVSLDLTRLCPQPDWERVTALHARAAQGRHRLPKDLVLKLWTQQETIGAWLPLTTSPDEFHTAPDLIRARFRLPPELTAGDVRLALQLSGASGSRFSGVWRQRTLDVSLSAAPDEPELMLTTGSDLADGIMGFLRRGAVAETEAICRELVDVDSSPALALVAYGYHLLRAGEIDPLRTWSGRVADAFPSLPDAAVIDGAAQLEAAQRVAASSGPMSVASRYARNRFSEALDWGLPVYTEGVRVLAEAVRQLERESPEAVVVLAGQVRALTGVSDDRVLTTTYVGEEPDHPGLLRALPDRRLGGPDLEGAGVTRPPVSKPVDPPFSYLGQRPLRNRFRDFLLWCSGTDPYLVVTRVEYSRYAGIGVYLLLTAVMSGALFAFTASTIAGHGALVPTLAGLLGAALIFFIDRSIVAEPLYAALPGSAGLGGLRHLWALSVRLSAYALRVVIAVIVSILVTEALLLVLFHDEINAEVAVTQQQRIGSVNSSTRASFAPQIVDLQTQVKANDDELNKANSEVDKAAADLQSELSGQSGSGQAGVGPLTEALRQRYDEAVANRDAVRKDTAERNGALQQQITRLQAQQAAAVARQTEAIQGDNGWITQITALGIFLDQQDSAALRSLPWLLRFLLLALELMPLTLKLVGRSTIYERSLRAQSAALSYQADHDLRLRQREIDLRGALAVRRPGISRTRPVTVLLVADSVAVRTAVIDVAASATGRMPKRVFTRQSVVFDLGPISNVNVLLIQRTPLGAEPGLNLALASELAPDHLVELGLCAGLRPSEQRVGDLVVADRLTARDEPRDLAAPRTTTTTGSAVLVNRLLNADPPPSARLHAGEVESRERLVREPGAVETSALAFVVEPPLVSGLDYRTNWVLVNAVADIVQSPGGEHETAIINLARFAVSVLESGALDEAADA